MRHYLPAVVSVNRNRVRKIYFPLASSSISTAKLDCEFSLKYLKLLLCKNSLGCVEEVPNIEKRFLKVERTYSNLITLEIWLKKLHHAQWVSGEALAGTNRSCKIVRNKIIVKLSFRKC